MKLVKALQVITPIGASDPEDLAVANSAIKGFAFSVVKETHVISYYTEFNETAPVVRGTKVVEILA